MSEPNDTHSNIEQQVLALAGVAQAARLVDQISKTGTYPIEFLEPSIHSLFVFNPEGAADIYGGVPGVKLGLHNLSSILADRNARENMDIVRYLFALLYLERRFAANPDMMSVVRSRLEHTSFRAEHFEAHVNELCHSVSGIYQDTLSKQRFRIKVTGSAQHLQDTQNADVIRALLLAGVRAAFLWRQLGGRRWKLLLNRRRLLYASQNLSRSLGVV
ncbi:MAG: high frequency lysogenization protein HflD [Halioglobus sp.]|nr:high frequency lysogenization protein HflD [Halioglobus sp.]